MELSGKQRLVAPTGRTSEEPLPKPHDEAEDAAIRREMLLGGIARRILSGIDPKDLAGHAVAAIGRGMAIDVCALFSVVGDTLVARPQDVFRTSATGSLAALTVSGAGDILARVEREGEIAVADTSVDRERAGAHGQLFRALLARAVLAVPTVVGSHVRGLLVLAMRHTTHPWRLEERLLAREAAALMGTALRQAELFDQVFRSKREWESTFDGMADAVFIYDGNRRVRRTNLSASEMLNRPLEKLVGLLCCDFGLCTGNTGCAVERAFVERARINIEVLSPRTYHVLNVTVDPMLDENGDVIGAIQVVRDLNDLRRTEAELKRQQQFLVNLVESTSDAIFVVDTAGRLVWSNSRLPAITGSLVSEMLGKPHTFLMSGGEVAEVQAHFEAAAIGETHTFDAAIRNTKTGEERFIVMTYSPIHEDGKVVSVLGVARDVTEERRVAERSQQADKLRALGQLASGVAHDVNNDLAAILGRVQRLMRTAEYDGFRHELSVVETAALDCAQTVRRIQNFARQQGDADLEPVDLNGLVRDAIEITRTRWLDDARSRGLTYTVQFEAGEIHPVMGDGSQLREVFVNLIINALDAMPSGGPLRISSHEARGEAVVRFADEGTGIPKTIRERIFEPFFTTKGALGTGMGLAVSYGIMTRHNGRIEVESDVGRGSAFTLVFPSAGDVTIPAPAQPAALVSALSVLVIDDEDVVREVLADLLEEQGHKVLQVESGRDGLEALERSPVDVVFTDLSMPEMDGWAVARAVRQRYPKVRVVMVTGYGTSVASHTEQLHLVDAVLGKPFEFDDISGILRRLYSE
jgi:PAS domain S-box-containing protein